MTICSLTKPKSFTPFAINSGEFIFVPPLSFLKVLNDHYFQKPNKSGEQFVRISVVCYFHWSRCWIAQCLALVVLLLSGLTVCQIGMPCSFILHDFKLMIYLGLTFKLKFWCNFQCEQVGSLNFATFFSLFLWKVITFLMQTFFLRD